MIFREKICKKCLYSECHPLGLTINDNGICSGCVIHEEKNTIDWELKWNKLKKLTKTYKSNHSYDCIVPITGAGDSYYTLHVIKNKLKLNPLLVHYNTYFNSIEGIKNLANLRTKFNCDILIQNINPISVKNITRLTLREFGSVYWHCLAGKTVFPVQTAVKYKIPLIIWGAHQGMEQVGMFSHYHEVEMTRRYRKDHDLMGFEADDLISKYDSISDEDIWQYRYPEDTEISSIGIRGIYLNNYIRWDPKAQHEEMIKLYNYQPKKFLRTFDTYDYTECNVYLYLHDLLKLYKHGYSKVTDQISREIRHGRITRDEGLILEAYYFKDSCDDLSSFCDWLNMDKQSLQLMIDFHRNPKFWKKKWPSEWEFIPKKSEVVNSRKNDVEKILKKLDYNLGSSRVIINLKTLIILF
jgi:N-acetyl sugar amidotransferase